MKAVVLLTCLALSCVAAPAAFAKKHPRVIESAKVISQNIDSYNGGTAVMPLAGGLVGVPIVRRSNIAVIETQTYRMTWSEAGRGTITLPVNGTVQFYRDGDWYVVLDSRNHKHKFALVHLEAIGR